MTKHKAKHSVRKRAPAEEAGKGRHHLVTPQVRWLGWRAAVGLVSAFATANDEAEKGGSGFLAPPPAAPLHIETFVTMPKEFTEVVVEIFEKGHDARPLVTILGDGSGGKFVARSATPHEPTSVPHKGYDLHARFSVDGPGIDPKKLIIPLEGHQDYPDESWDLYLKVTAAGKVVQDDWEIDGAHVWVDWPDGAVVFPMLGAPAIVDAKSPWLECLVATKVPLPVGAEKFFLASQLRLYKWGTGHDVQADEKERQKALAKRTIDLKAGADIEFSHYTFDELSSDADEDRDSSFKMKLGFLQHFSRAQLDFAREMGWSDAESARDRPAEAGMGGATWTSADAREKSFEPRHARVHIPALTADGEGLPAGDVHLYKVRLELKEGPGLYDLVWMNGSDFHQARKVALKVEKKVHLSQDARLREALHVLLTGNRLTRDPQDTDREPGAAEGSPPPYDPWHPSDFQASCVTYQYDGHPQPEKDDPWKPSRNFLDKPTDLTGFRAYHPVCVVSGERFQRIGHLTDIHLDARLDVMAQLHTVDGTEPLQVIPQSAPPEIQTLPVADLINNYNATFFDLAHRVLKDADALVLTGDLTDYNRGFAAPPDPAKAKSGFEARYTWRVIGGDRDFEAYKTGRNWSTVYSMLVSFYTKHRKPIFTVLGNHDYRPKPYGILPGVGSAGYGSVTHPYDTLAGDLNLTIYESIMLYGPSYGGLSAKDPAALLQTAPDAPRWYDYVINGWKDFYAFHGDQALILLDWDVEEDNIEARHPGILFHLPRAKRFMTKTQRSIYDRLVKAPVKGPEPWRVLCTHATLACNNPKVFVTNHDARNGVGLSELRWGTMGASSAGGGEDSPEARKTREMIAGHLMDKTLRLTLSGHSHMDGVYRIYETSDVEMLWPQPAISQTSWMPGDPVPPGGPAVDLEMKPVPDNVDQCAVVTNSGGPCGEYVERKWSRRSRPSGNIFAFDGKTIKMRHVASSRLSAIPRRCVHDAEKERIERGAFLVLDYDFKWAQGYDRLDDVSSYVSGYFVYLLDQDDPKLNGLSDLYLAVHARDDDKWYYERSNIVMRAGDADGKSWRQKCWFAFTRRHLERCGHWAGSPHGHKPIEVFMLLRYPGGDARHNWAMAVEPMLMPFDARVEYDAQRNGVVSHSKMKIHFSIQHEVPFDGAAARWKTTERAQPGG